MTLEHSFSNAVVGMSSRVYLLEDKSRLVIIRDDDAQQDLDVSMTFRADQSVEHVCKCAKQVICIREHSTHDV